jgi:hypothetical protein
MQIMATRTTVVLTDDLDGSGADETVQFGLDGRDYEIDLSDTNASKLRDSLAAYVAAGRRTARAGAGGKPTSGAAANSMIRDWARANGYEVSDRGRISTDVRTAYEHAN